MAEDSLEQAFGKGYSGDSDAQPTGDPVADALNKLNSSIQSLNDKLDDVTGPVSDIARDGKRSAYGQRRAGDRTGASASARYRRDRNSDPAKTFMDGLTGQLMKSLGGNDVEKQMTKSLQTIAKKMGTTIDKVPEMLGQQVGQAFQKTKLGSKLTAQLEKNADKYFMGISKSAITKWGDSKISGKYGKNIAGALTYSSGGSAVPPPSRDESKSDEGGSGFLGKAKEKVSGAVKGLFGGGGETPDAGGAVQNIANTMADGGGEAIADAVGGAVGDLPLGEIIDMLGPIMEATNIMSVAMSPIQAIMPLIESVAKAISVISKIFGKDDAMDEQRTKNAQERYKKDIETIVETPFKILEDAAQKVMDAWDSALRVINQTQGYNKASLQGLMSDYAQRLRNEGLTSVISGADITTNLSTVLNSGLSGKVAEEFAYIATVLGAAIPTQDFFSYGSSYASLAANAIQQGMSQADALEMANNELKQFASNILYSSRVLTGGFTTGLQDASNLFDLAVQIVNSARGGSVSSISGVLTAVAGVVGAVAPDLASGLTSVLGTLALGGNSGSAVALRSLAGINASNTEFLNAFVQNPQGVIANVFSGLARYQTMSESNYMEVAEGLAEVFGVDMASFARVDFAALADSIKRVAVNTSSLDENMELLQSGQSTLTSEQQRYQQINKYMLEEGLSLVLDNEAGRAIQQHMWQEQIANQMMEAEYGVELHGAGLDLLQSLRSTLKNVLSLLFPWFGTVKAAVNLATTSVQMADQMASIGQILKAGAVGEYNRQEYSALTTRGVQNLGLIGDLQSLWGINSVLHTVANITEGIDEAISGDWGKEILYQGGKLLRGEHIAGSAKSLYRWGALSKSMRSTLAQRIGGAMASATMSAEDRANQMLVENVNAFLGSMDSAIQSNMGYQDWLNTSSKYGLERANLESSIAKAGQSMANLEEAFSDKQTEQEKQKSQDRQDKEEEFWEKTTLNEDSYLKTISDEMVDLHKDIRIWATSWDNINNRYGNYYGANSRGYLFEGGIGYTNGLYNARELLNRYQTTMALTQAEMPIALADALIEGLDNIDLKDPTAQTNVLLSQLIKVVVSILQTVNSPGKLDIPSSLSAMALGMITPTE